MSDIELNVGANETLVPMELPGGNKKKRTGFVVALIAVAVIILLTIVGILIYNMRRSPQARLADGYAIMLGEMEDYGVDLGDRIDYESVLERMETEPSAVDMSFNLTLPQENDIPTIGFDIKTEYDIPKELFSGNMLLSVFNIKLFEFDLTASGDELYISLPNLVEGIYYLNGSTLGKDYNNSEWPEILGLEVEDDFSFDLFAQAGQAEKVSSVDGALVLAITENIVKIKETTIIEKTKEVIEIERDGKTVKCDGFRVVVSKDALNDFIADLHREFKNSNYMQTIIAQTVELYGNQKDIQEVEAMCEELVDGLFSIRYAKDVALYFYLDSKDRIVSIATAEDISFENSSLETINFSFEFTGKTRTMDEVNGQIMLKSETGKVSILINRVAELTKDSYLNHFNMVLTDEIYDDTMQFDYVNEWNLEEDEFKYEITLDDQYGDSIAMVAKGSFSDIVKGERFTLNLGELSLLTNEEAEITISGKIKVEPLKGTIIVPDGAKDIMKLNSNEVFAIILELFNSFNDLSDGITF